MPLNLLYPHKYLCTLNWNLINLIRGKYCWGFPFTASEEGSPWTECVREKFRRKQGGKKFRPREWFFKERNDISAFRTVKNSFRLAGDRRNILEYMRYQLTYQPRQPTTSYAYVNRVFVANFNITAFLYLCGESCFPIQVVN